MIYNFSHMSMVHRYNRGAATHSYIFGFIRDGAVWAVYIKDARDLLYLVTNYEDSGKRLVYRPSLKQQDILIANADQIEILYSVKYMEQHKYDFGDKNGNRGKLFEASCAKRFHGTQHQKQTLKFTEGGDIVLQDGTEVQCKFGSGVSNIKTGATFTTIETLDSMGL